MKKLVLFFALMLAALGLKAADFSSTLNGGEFFFNIVDEDAATCEFAPNPNGPYNLTLNAAWLPSTVDYNGKTYTIIGVGVEAFKDGYVTNGANNNTAKQREFWGFPTTLTYVRADAFNGFRSNFPALLRGNVTEFDPTAMRNNKLAAINSAGQTGTYRSVEPVSAYTVNSVTDTYNVIATTYECSVGSVIYKETDGIKELVAYPGDLRHTYHNHYQSGVNIYPFNGLHEELIDSVDATAYQKIGPYAFYGNENVKCVNFSDDLTEIGAHAFENTVLTELNLPMMLENVGEDAFKGVTSIEFVICMAMTPPNIVFEDEVYNRISRSGNIFVLDEEPYKADPNWGRFWQEPPKMYIAGTFTDWANGKLEMTEDNGTYTITVNGIEDGAEFKFIEGDEDPVWYGAEAEGETYGVHKDWCTDIPLSTSGQNLKIQGRGDLTFTISPDKKLTITGWPNELYLAGNMTNWADGKEAMTLNEETGKFSITKEMEAGAEFKFINEDGTWIGGDADGKFIVTEEQVTEGAELSLLLNGGNNFQIPVAGTWTLTVDKATMKLVIAGEWPAPKYAVTIAEGIENGAVVADKDEVEEGEIVTLSVTPAEGYQLDVLSVMNGETPVDYEGEDGSYTFTMPAAPVTVSATFSQLPPPVFIITVNEAENGTVEADKEEAVEGDVVTLTITPDEGYELESLTVMNGEEPVETTETENGATFVMPAAPVTVTATFVETVVPPVESVITFNAAPENGTVAVYVGETQIESGAEVAEGTEVKVVLTPAEGYEVDVFSIETVEGSDLPSGLRRASVPATQGDDGSYTFNMPGEPIAINATFKESTVTAINDLRAAGYEGEVYVDVMGRVSSRPFKGVNIVVKADGTVTKMVK